MRKPPSDSEEKPRVLFLAPECPYPMRGGGPLRCASLLEYLARRFAVHAIVFRQPGDPDPALAIPPGRIEKLDALELPHHSKFPPARALRNFRRLILDVPPLLDRFAGFERRIAALVAGRQYQYAVIEHFWCAPYVEQLRPRSRRMILDLHNVESAWHQSLAETESGARAWALRRFAGAAARLERDLLPKFDDVLVASHNDAQLVCGLSPSAGPIVYPNALPEFPAPIREERREIAFSGNLEYAPNISAVRFFRDQVWPSLRSRPNLQWKIIGKNPDAVRALLAGDPAVEVTGPVDDAVAALASAQVAVVPLLAGSGTRIKILEAWAAGTPVVSTTIGAQGLECRDQEHLLIADTPDRFSAAVTRLLDSYDDRRRLGAAGRRLYEERYTWQNAWEVLDPLFGTVSKTGRS